MKYPHTLTSEQFAIISVALDGSREREAAYVAKHADRPDDHLRALDELRKLWAFRWADRHQRAEGATVIPDPSTLKRIRAQADAFAAGRMALLDLRLTPGQHAFATIEIRDAYLAGADAGYTAAKAEER